MDHGLMVIMKEMGRVKHNIELCDKVIEIHQRKYNNKTGNPEQAEIHLDRCEWWVMKKLSMMEHLSQLHDDLYAKIRENRD